MLILSQFVLRLSFGLALAMGLTSSRQVTSGFFRNHSYVLIGLNVLAILAAWSDREHLFLWAPVVGAVLSYLAAVAWLYENAKLGKALLWVLAWLSLATAGEDEYYALGVNPNAPLYQVDVMSTALVRQVVGRALVWGADPASAGLLLGSTIAAMFLGHWYLNSPTMQLAPLQRLCQLMAAAVLTRALVCFVATVLLLGQGTNLSTGQLWMLVLRWSAGIFGAGALAWMAWETLRIPNTQSATGILYVAVVATFVGELTSLLLSGSTGFPL